MKFFKPLGEGLQAGSQAGSRQILGEPYANVRVLWWKVFFATYRSWVLRL